MEILAVLVMIGLAVSSAKPAVKVPVKVRKVVKDPVRDYSDRPYGSVKYLEDM